MAELTDVGATCRAKVGMLVLRDCGATATAACDVCGRPLCRSHQCPTATGVACPECAAQDEQVADRGTVRRARRRSRWYRSHHYRPYYYHYGPDYYDHYYSDHDYRTFDRSTPREVAAEQGAAAAETDAEAEADEVEIEDYDES